MVINVDDPFGHELASSLMPDQDWEPIRAIGMTPIARGLVDRGGLQEILDEVGQGMGDKLRACIRQPLLVVDSGHISIYEIE